MGLLRINAATLIKCTLGELSKPVDCWQETNLVSVLMQLNLVAKVRLTDEPSRLQKSCFLLKFTEGETNHQKCSNSRNANHWKRVLANQRKSALAKREPLKARTRETRTTEIAHPRIDERAHSRNANHWKCANVTWGTKQKTAWILACKAHAPVANVRLFLIRLFFPFLASSRLLEGRACKKMSRSLVYEPSHVWFVITLWSRFLAMWTVTLSCFFSQVVFTYPAAFICASKC